MNKGKKYEAAVKKYDKGERYELGEALKMVKDFSFANFDETVEIAMKLGVDPRHADQMVRGTVVLPHGIGKKITVLVFAEGEKAEEAKDAGADYVGSDDLIEKVKDGWMEFDTAITIPSMMSKIKALGRFLGPRGLMPNPKAGTLTTEIGKAVKEAKAGKVEFRVDKTSNLHVPIGKVSFPLDKLEENASTFILAVFRARPAAAKGQYFRSMTVCSTMGPGVKLDIQNVINTLKR
jgi:large subunit ribosomal protein L1